MNEGMQLNTHPAASVATTLTYGTSIGLVLGDTLEFLNHNAAACGVILGFMTFLVNLYFQIQNHKAIKARIND